MSSQHMFTKLQVKNFSKGMRTLYVHFVTSDDCVSKKINNREIQAHFALKIIMLFKLKTIVSLQNEGCKVEFNQPSCWLYSVPNLPIF